MEKRVLAFDFGASGGRAMAGIYNGEKIVLEELHRFSNDPVTVCGVMYWDVLRLFYEMKQGILKGKQKGGFESIGIDTWGVDFGLLDKNGILLENPVHYRDNRTKGMLEKSFDYIDKERFYEITGNQFMEINTAFQLLSLSQNRPEFLERGETLLLMPDLFTYMLTGAKGAEYSIASTTQLLDARKRSWSYHVIEKLGLPTHIFPNIIQSGTKMGPVSKEICQELMIHPVEVISVASHDTQSALLAVTAKEKDFLFISCGTWSLLGTELEAPIIKEKSQKYNITNEGGCDKKAVFLKNMIGLWLIQESRRQWIREGKEYGFGDLEKMAKETKKLCSFIDPDAPEFIPQGNIPKKIQEFCKKTNQPVPETVGEIVRCINESLALKYRIALEEIEECTGKKYNTIYMVGGGTQSELLCQCTADACNRMVAAGPIEATVLGNLALQLVASGDIEDTKEARELIARSQEIKVYEPHREKEWEEAYGKFKNLLIGW